MQDRDLYSQILGIREPWKVDRVDLDLKQGEVNVHLTHDAGGKVAVPGMRDSLSARTTISRGGGGGIWTPASCGRF